MRVDDSDRLVGVAGLADHVEVRAEVAPQAGSPDRVIVGEDDPHLPQISHVGIPLSTRLPR